MWHNQWSPWLTSSVRLIHPTCIAPYMDFFALYTTSPDFLLCSWLPQPVQIGIHIRTCKTKMCIIRAGTNTYTYDMALDWQYLVSPVGLGEQDGGVWLADEVFVSHFANAHYLLLPPGHHLQGQGGLYFWPQHAQVRRQRVDEDLGGIEKRNQEISHSSSALPRPPIWTQRLKTRNDTLNTTFTHISLTQTTSGKHTVI